MSGTVNAPRFRVTMNGVAMDGMKEMHVKLAKVFQVGTFSLVKAFVTDDAFPASWFADTGTKTMLVEIDVSTDGTTFQTLLTGNVDSHGWDVVANTVTMAGRDQAAVFLDTRTVGTLRNQTASQIAQTLAASHGLTAEVGSDAALVGRKYDIDFDKTKGGDFSEATNEWDLLCRLGSQAGIAPYMQGSVLCFQPPPSSPPSYAVTVQRGDDGLVMSAEGLTLERHMTTARDVIVTVESWNSKAKKKFSATYRTSTKKASGDADVQPTRYFYRLPNYTQAQCQDYATQKALDISTHERNIQVRAPSFVMLTPVHVVSVSGTGTDYDQTYYPQAISYAITFDHGASTDIAAKYSSPIYLYDNDTGEQVGESA
jgi:phage protein D